MIDDKKPRPVPSKDQPIRLSSLDDLTPDNIDAVLEQGAVINLRSLRRKLEEDERCSG